MVTGEMMKLLLLVAFSAVVSGQKPEFPSYSQDIISDVGGWLRVPCKAQGEMPIAYKWYNQNAEQITGNTNSTIYASQSDDQSFLTFTDVTMEDRGTYTCSAINSYGQVNKVFALRVLNPTGMKPEFHVSFENLTGKAGKLLEIQCLAMGERPITYSWYNEIEDKIPEDDRSSVYVVRGEKYSILNFQKLSIAQQGTYTCTASNVHGLVSKVFLLNVVSPDAVVVLAAGSDVPSLVTDPNSSQLTGVEGEPFNVSCEGAGANSSMFSDMKWTDSDGKVITATQRNPKSVQIEDKLFLIFTSPKLKNSGPYQCAALYDGTQQLERKVFIEFYAEERIRGKKPKFQYTTYNASVEQGLNVKLYCSAESKLPLTYDWFNQAGNKISRDPRKRVFVSNSTRLSILTINKVRQLHDEGQYICMAKNLNGLESKFYNLDVLTEEEKNSLHGVDVLRMVTHPVGPYVPLLEGHSLNVSCNGDGGDRSKFSEPKWKSIDGEDMCEGDPGVSKRDGHVFLTFMNPRINDSTSFLCTALYDNEVELQYEIFVEIHGQKPEFLIYSQDIVTDVGGWLKVPCQAHGEMPIAYKWYDPNADQITEATNSTIYASQSVDQSFLTFTDVSIGDGGTYTCSASNSHGQVNKFYILRVLSAKVTKPEFHEPYERVTAMAGKPLELQCLAMGERPVTYNWYNQVEDEINEDGRSSVYAVNGEKYSVLKFQKLSLAHHGTYTCTASNVHGLVSKVFLLNVVSHP